MFGPWPLGITLYGKDRSKRHGRGRLEVVDMIRSKELMGIRGRISALQIDPATAQVGQAEVQVSLFEDLAHGCRVVQASTDLAIRDDRVMYHPPENSG